HRFLSTKYCSVVALPSLTSCVHCSSGSLMPNALSIAKAMSRKSRLSMPRSSIAWLSGWIFSRGISHVSAMILATVSNVEDIINSLENRELRPTRRAARTSPGRAEAARSANALRARPYSQVDVSAQCRVGLPCGRLSPPTSMRRGGQRFDHSVLFEHLGGRRARPVGASWRCLVHRRTAADGLAVQERNRRPIGDFRYPAGTFI